MMFSQKLLGVIYLDRNRLDWARPTDLVVVSCPLPETAVADLEVISQIRLDQCIRSFVEAQKIVSCSLILLLSPNVFFEKDLSNVGGNQLAAETENFLEIIPFENIVKKTLVFDTKTKIIAANRNLIDGIDSALKKVNCSVLSVLPTTILNGAINKNGLDPAVSQNLIHHLDAFRQFNLLEEKSQKIDHVDKPGPSPKRKSKRNLFVLAGIFICLIAVLVFLIWRSRQPVSPRRDAPAALPSIPTPTLIPTLPFVSPTGELSVSESAAIE